MIGAIAGSLLLLIIKRGRLGLVDDIVFGGMGGQRAMPMRKALLAVVLAATLLAPARAAVGSGGPPSGSARIWLYRDYQPYVSMARPYVRFNGRAIGISEPGGAFYRDVPPGR